MSAVSVVMPVYNCRPYLAECLASVLSQTLADLEVLCIDDGSTDGSAEILAAYAAKDPRVRVFSQANAGAAAARNLGLTKAAGDYVAFMDGDDLYPSVDVLERLYREAESHHAKMCGGGMEMLLPDGEIRRRLSGDDVWMNGFASAGDVSFAEYPYDYGFTRFLYHRSLFAVPDAAFPQTICYEDPIFFVKMAARAKSFRAVDFATYRYRVGYKPTSGTGRAWPRERLLACLDGCTMVLDLARTNGFAALEKEKWAWCCGPELSTMVGRQAYLDRGVFDAVCALDRRSPDGRHLRIIEEMRSIAARCTSLPSYALFGLGLLKRSVGALLPEGLKFWHR